VAQFDGPFGLFLPDLDGGAPSDFLPPENAMGSSERLAFSLSGLGFVIMRLMKIVGLLIPILASGLSASGSTCAGIFGRLFDSEFDPLAASNSGAR
jgi:hypothetical protein